MSEAFLLAIPVFNEEKYLERVLCEARKYLPNILVIDDGSTDSTPKLLARSGLADVVRHPENRGYGASLASAFDFAMNGGYSWLITMDCDEQHEPAFIPKFVEAAEEDLHDIISGSRYMTEMARQDAPPPDRQRINAEMTRIINDRLKMNITDAFCGFKAYRVSSLGHFDITVPGYAMPMQHWVQAKCAGLRVAEIPVRLIYNDPTRHFGGLLDDPISRREHYLEVFEAEMARMQACGCRRSSDCGMSAA